METQRGTIVGRARKKNTIESQGKKTADTQQVTQTKKTKRKGTIRHLDGHHFEWDKKLHRRKARAAGKRPIWGIQNKVVEKGCNAQSKGGVRRKKKTNVIYAKKKNQKKHNQEKNSCLQTTVQGKKANMTKEWGGE